MYINVGAITRRVQEAFDILELDSVEKVEDAGYKFAEVLNDEIAGRASMALTFGGLTQQAINELNDVEVGEPYHSAKGKNIWDIDINFFGDLTRDSLYPEKYPDGVDNIIALLNNGYFAHDSVYGLWRGKQTKSLAKRLGSQFIQSAVNIFRTTYASQYNVVDIWVNPAYEE